METPDSRMKIPVPLDDWELNFLIDLLGPPEDMSPRTLKLYRTLKGTRLPSLHEPPKSAHAATEKLY
jgi:hypothetical protein